MALRVRAAASLCAATTATWEMNTYQDFLKGRFDGVSLDRDGRLHARAEARDRVLLRPARHLEHRAGAGRLHLRGHRPSRTRLSDRASRRQHAGVDRRSAGNFRRRGGSATACVYAATSPDGKVYRIENGKATEFFAPQGQIHLGRSHSPRTEACSSAPAIPAKSIAWTKPARPRLYYETGQSHVTALAFDSQGNLLAGTEPNGILYRISAKDKAFVLYNASLPEIRSIVPMPDGTIYAAALGGSIANRSATAHYSRSRRHRASR